MQTWPEFVRRFGDELPAFEALKLFARLPVPDDDSVPRVLPKPMPVVEQQRKPLLVAPLMTLLASLQPEPPAPPRKVGKGSKGRARSRAWDVKPPRQRLCELEGDFADAAAVAAAVGLSSGALAEMLPGDPLLRIHVERLCTT